MKLPFKVLDISDNLPNALSAEGKVYKLWTHICQSFKLRQRGEEQWEGYSILKSQSLLLHFAKILNHPVIDQLEQKNLLQDLDEVLKILEGVFMPFIVLLIQRCIFYSTVQKRNETSAEYLRTLESLAQTCEFESNGEVTLDKVREQFKWGLRPDVPQGKIEMRGVRIKLVRCSLQPEMEMKSEAMCCTCDEEEDNISVKSEPLSPSFVVEPEEEENIEEYQNTDTGSGSYYGIEHDKEETDLPRKTGGTVNVTPNKQSGECSLPVAVINNRTISSSSKVAGEKGPNASERSNDQLTTLKLNATGVYTNCIITFVPEATFKHMLKNQTGRRQIEETVTTTTSFPPLVRKDQGFNVISARDMQEIQSEQNQTENNQINTALTEETETTKNVPLLQTDQKKNTALEKDDLEKRMDQTESHQINIELNNETFDVTVIPLLKSDQEIGTTNCENDDLEKLSKQNQTKKKKNKKSVSTKRSAPKKTVSTKRSAPKKTVSTKRSAPKKTVSTKPLRKRCREQRKVCERCGEIFNGNDQLQLHLETNESCRSELTCQHCGKWYLKMRALIRHQKLHTTPLVCEICSKACKSERQLETHMLFHKGEKDLTCDHCGQSFVSCSALEKHEREQHSAWKKKHMCEICGSAFDVRIALTIHMETHATERAFKCDQCPGTFKGENGLQTHKYKMHRSVKFSHKCDLCEKEFRHRGTLLDHKRQEHCDEGISKPFVCNLCDKRFIYASMLRSHMVSHSSKRPFPCDECDLKFGRRSHLNRHKVTRHGEKPYKCDVCQLGFIVRNQMLKHRQSHSSEITGEPSIDGCRDLEVEECKDMEVDFLGGE